VSKWAKVYFLFFIMGLLLYFNSLNNKFLLDDYVFRKNPVLSDTKYILSQWNPYREAALGVVDRQESPGYYRPMAHMVLDLSYAFFKNSCWQYHLLNLFLFVLASSLIYLLIERVTGNYNLACLTGLFYLIHPINGIIVNYISASVLAFQLICTLAAILLLWGALERKNDRTLYFFSLFFSFLSLFWNESGVMTPFYICAVVLLFRKGPLRSKAFYLFPYFLIVLSYFVFRFFFFSAGGNIVGIMSSLHLTPGEYGASLFQVFAWYLSKLFYPQGIVMQWATPVVHDHIMGNVLGLCLLGIIFLLLFVKFSKEKTGQLALVWVLTGFAPVCVAAFLIPMNGVQIEPHWFVVSSIGFFVLAAYCFLFVLDQMKKWGVVLLFILILAWGGVSWANNQLWADQKTYALYWSQQAPHLKLPFYALGDIYREEGNFKESMKYYRMALSGYFQDEGIYNNMGLINDSDGHWKEAELNYKRVLTINPHSSRAYTNLGNLYLKQGQWKQATEFFHQALANNPLSLEPRRGLARILFEHADYKKAIDLCLINLDIVNDDTETLFLLIDIFIDRKDLVNLKKYAYHMVNSQTDPQVLTRLGILMAQHNVFNIALDCYIKVMRVVPDYKDAYLAAGTLLANLGKYDEAILLWKQGLSIDPSDQRFKKDITKALRLKGSMDGKNIK